MSLAINSSLLNSLI
uniref:Uncharacterized protein n=1 Tax=Rhizophora mucronata TaxID=61149 RepID=A0A2P2LHQ3_RHIMU